MLKVVFLDFDGVVSTQNSGWNIDPAKVALIDRLCQETGAQIVVSSSWRIGETPESLQKILGCQSPVIGLTPWPRNDVVRGDEIRAWLKSHGRDVEAYVILDDETDAGHGHDGHFVWVKAEPDGFNESHLALCTQVLNGNLNREKLDYLNPFGAREWKDAQAGDWFIVDGKRHKVTSLVFPTLEALRGYEGLHPGKGGFYAQVPPGFTLPD